MTSQIVSLRISGRREGFTLLEILAVIFIVIILMSIALSSLSHSWKRDPVMQATDRVLFLLEQARAEAIAIDGRAALIVVDDRNDSGHRRKLNVATFISAPSSSHNAPASAALCLRKKWVMLPKQVVIEFAFSSNNEPNAFSIATQGGAVIGLRKASVSGDSRERHAAVRCLIFDQYGAVIADNNRGNWVQYVNNNPTVFQKGCYLILHNDQRRPDGYNGSNDFSHLAKIYISPLTGRATKL